MARVAVVGVGAIGGVLASLLETTGQHEITLCTRRPMELLTVITPDGAVTVKARNLTDPQQAQPVDWVLVATKTYDAAGAGEWLKTLAPAGTPVAVVQNGVEHKELFAPYVAVESIVPVVINTPAEREADGTVVQRGSATMKVEDGPLGAGFKELFAGSKVKIELTADFKSAAWQKLCINAAGAITAMAIKPAGIFHDEAVAQLAREMVAEVVAVGRAEGARLNDELCQRVVDGYRRQPQDSVNSLLADRMAGRRMETGARNGVIVRLGKKHGITTPLNEMAVVVLDAATSRPAGGAAN
jgi:2-dehydropantoate 2-reductase